MPDSQDANRDPEFDAITAIVGALKPLDEEARQRVLDYALRRLGLRDVGQTPPVPLPGSGASEQAAQTIRVQQDIRSLRESKEPKSAIEMAALVGYYLAHLAPESDRRVQMTAADITKYFHQANFPLPEAASMTLVHAKNAGYLDAGAERGSYKLNPVGYNLVAHRLPAAATAPTRTKPRRASTRVTSKSRKRRRQGSASAKRKA